MIIRGLILIFIYFFFYNFLRDLDSINNLYLELLNYYALFLVKTSKFILEMLGYTVVSFGKTVRIIDNSSTSGVYLNKGCMGRDFLLVFTGFIIAFPGKINDKLWFIPTGISLLIVVNLIRIVGLAVVTYCCPTNNIGINNHDLFKYSAWTVILILWFFWINKYSRINEIKFNN